MSLQVDHNMASAYLILTLLESIAEGLKIVDGMHWKHAMIRVNVSNVTTKHLINK